MKTFVLIGFFLLFCPAQAASFCIEPELPLGDVPSAPGCGRSGDLSNCSQWEKSYFKSKVRDYIDAMHNYENEVIKFVQCKQSEAVDNWNRFVRGY